MFAVHFGKKVMDTAEALAWAGKQHLVQAPEYIFLDMSEEKTKPSEIVKRKYRVSKQLETGAGLLLTQTNTRQQNHHEC